MPDGFRADEIDLQLHPRVAAATIRQLTYSPVRGREPGPAQWGQHDGSCPAAGGGGRQPRHRRGRACYRTRIVSVARSRGRRPPSPGPRRHPFPYIRLIPFSISDLELHSCRHWLRIDTAQMHRFCAYHGNRITPWLIARIGGSARGYGRLFPIPSAIPLRPSRKRPSPYVVA